MRDIETETFILEKSIHALEKNLSEKRRSLRALRSEHALTQDRLDANTYPVLTLPNEIISDIFVHVLPVYPLCPQLSGPLSPNFLTQICRKWRQIALHTPTLWRAIPLYCMPKATFEQHISIIECWLSRSGNCPLSSHMADDADMPSEVPTEDFLVAILPHCARWEHVRLVIDSDQLSSIEGPCRHFWWGQPSISVAISVALQLRTATLWDFRYPPHLLPWSQLASLTLVVKKPEECAHALRQSINLVYCEVILLGDDDDSQPDFEIKLDRLETLIMVRWLISEAGVTGFLETFVVPSLRFLQIPDEFMTPDPIAALKTVILKSGCKLLEVLITGPRSLSKVSYRQAFPSIPKFSFNAVKVDFEDKKYGWAARSDSNSSDVESSSE
ncbi:F-box domain-containing protein [Mycena venus]|uniref:F-box domain-containing protein n=1 Tax=Mycena venus TaxID=2733690 RepID=A0A8H6X5I0_9AGAR|nr:F-box domain-containing protein [Mycena venus]